MRQLLFNVAAAISLAALLVLAVTVYSLTIGFRPSGPPGYDFYWFGIHLDCDAFHSPLAKLYKAKGFVAVPLEVMPGLWLWVHRRTLRTSLLPLVSKRHRRKHLGLCIECGYDLRAHRPGQICPECGTPVPPSPASPALGQTAPPPSASSSPAGTPPQN